MSALVNRRRFVVTGCLGALAIPLAVHAQPARKAFQIGWPLAGSGPVPHLETAFLGGLRDLGYVQGRDFGIELRCCAGGDLERLNGFVDELVRKKVDMLIVNSPQVAVAAKKATSTIPIVFVGVANPVTLGLVQSLAQPGGNITGVTHIAGAGGDMLSKHVELIKEIVPSAARVAILINPTNPIFQRLDIRKNAK